MSADSFPGREPHDEDNARPPLDDGLPGGDDMLPEDWGWRPVGGPADAVDWRRSRSIVIGQIGGKNPGQVRYTIGRAVLAIDPQAARKRREEAEKDARVEFWAEDAGTAARCGFHLPAKTTLAADQAITAWAQELKDAGVPGTMDALRARAHLDLILGQDSRPAPAGKDHPASPGRPGQPAADSQRGTDGQRGKGGTSGDGGPGDNAAPGSSPTGSAGPSRPRRPGTGAAKINLTMVKRSSYARYRGY